MSDIEQKLNVLVETHVNYIKKDGSTRISTCDHYNWDRDIWNHRHAIINAFKGAGYEVTTSTNHGVLDIDIVKLSVFDIQKKVQDLSDMDNISRDDYGINKSY